MNPKKCTFIKQVKYLTHIFVETTKKKKKISDKIRVIQKFRKMSLNWKKKFFGISTCLVENKIQYNWINDCQKAFQELKIKLA